MSEEIERARSYLVSAAKKLSEKMPAEKVSKAQELISQITDLAKIAETSPTYELLAEMKYTLHRLDIIISHHLSYAFKNLDLDLNDPRVFTVDLPFIASLIKDGRMYKETILRNVSNLDESKINQLASSLSSLELTRFTFSQVPACLIPLLARFQYVDISPETVEDAAIALNHLFQVWPIFQGSVSLNLCRVPAKLSDWSEFIPVFVNHFILLGIKVGFRLILFSFANNAADHRSAGQVIFRSSWRKKRKIHSFSAYPR